MDATVSGNRMDIATGRRRVLEEERGKEEG